jgi:hypothetical protein
LIVSDGSKMHIEPTTKRAKLVFIAGKMPELAITGAGGAHGQSSRAADHPTDQRTVLLQKGLGGKFQAASSAWDENRTFLEGDVLAIAVRFGRWVLCHVPAGPPPPAAPADFPTEE